MMHYNSESTRCIDCQQLKKEGKTYICMETKTEIQPAEVKDRILCNYYKEAPRVAS